jgi:SulP family sulfate permease
MTPKILTTLRTYSGPLFLDDLFAGVTVALVAIPLSLAIAIASGADPAAGLVTAIIAGFLISALGGSRVQIGGPTGAFIVVVFGVIAAHGYDGLVLATFMAGIILVLAGLMRAGNLISFVPEAVVNGFTIGIAIIIAASQVRDLFGLQVAHLPAEFVGKVEALWAARSSVNWAALGIGAATMALIAGLRRIAPRFPGLIVAVGLTSAAVALLDLPVETIGSRFGALPSQLPAPRLPGVGLDRIVELLPSAFVIAFLAGVESLLSAMVADRMTGGQYRRNAEVMAQGGGQYRIGAVWWPACHRCNRPDGDQCARRWQDPHCRHCPRIHHFAGRAVCSPACRIPGHAGPRRPADADRLEHERTAQMARLSE